MRVTILGCGGSHGVPMIGNDWGRCDPANPRNERRRASILVEQGDTHILVDTSPDLRAQLLGAQVRWLDAVLYTHAHADHTHGIDDLRSMNSIMGRDIPIYADRETLESLMVRFSYCFRALSHAFYYKPVLLPHRIEGPWRIGDLLIRPFAQDHGYTTSQGFRFGNFAYSTDVVNFDDKAWAVLAGIDTWIVDCVRLEPEHPVHAHLPKVLDWVERLRPRRTILTHMNQTMDYAQVSAILPRGIEVGYDNMVLEVPLT
ncbi:MAG: MBL fold metallo-hydrolase [Azospirillaceae bacterium]|nr:MBL fold metallo-hydrolase [Azospirillaceae bacterium]